MAVLSGSLTFDPSLPVGGAVTALHVEYLIGIDPYPPGAVPEPALAVLARVAGLALACFRRASRGSIAP